MGIKSLLRVSAEGSFRLHTPQKGQIGLFFIYDNKHEGSRQGKIRLVGVCDASRSSACR